MIAAVIMIIIALAFYVFYCSTIHRLTKTVNLITDGISPTWLSWFIQPVLVIPFLGIFISLFLWWCSHVQFLAMPLKKWADNNNEMSEKLSSKIKSFYDNLRGIFFIGLACGISELLFYLTEVPIFETLSFLLYACALIIVIFILVLANRINQELTLTGKKKNGSA